MVTLHMAMGSRSDPVQDAHVDGSAAPSLRASVGGDPPEDVREQCHRVGSNPGITASAARPVLHGLRQFCRLANQCPHLDAPGARQGVLDVAGDPHMRVSDRRLCLFVAQVLGRVVDVPLSATITATQRRPTSW